MWWAKGSHRRDLQSSMIGLDQQTRKEITRGLPFGLAERTNVGVREAVRAAVIKTGDSQGRD